MLRRPEHGAARARAFTGAFLRPFGPTVASTPIFVDEVERLGRAPAPSALTVPPALRGLRSLLEPLARRAARSA
jgi:hypothetical protein